MLLTYQSRFGKIKLWSELYEKCKEVFGKA